MRARLLAEDGDLAYRQGFAEERRDKVSEGPHHGGTFGRIEQRLGQSDMKTKFFHDVGIPPMLQHLFLVHGQLIAFFLFLLIFAQGLAEALEGAHAC